MKRAKFEYLGPDTMEAACAILAEKGGAVHVLAGGSDLMLKITHGMVKPECVMGLKKIKGLDEILFDPKRGLRIGAMARLVDVATHPAILKRYPAVARGAGETANTQIRNMGTVIGNICNAAPSADNAPALMAMRASVILASLGKEREVALDRFFKGPGQTMRRPDELVTAVTVPLPRPRSGASYQHISPRGKVDISAVCVGVMLVMDGKTCETARVVLGAVAPVPMRALKTEQLLEGRVVTDSVIDKAGRIAASEARPISDVRASAAYRRQMVSVLTRRGIKEALNRATGRKKG
ncbi:MAG: xanthine dehydrogenase family protein subunit M [Deltaproteobacteria bacterium]|nr:xanthine dehydrogenase family protein subunit M [Deltaproteobacteria bacterium]